MKKILTIFFVTLGVIFFMLILAVAAWLLLGLTGDEITVVNGVGEVEETSALAGEMQEEIIDSNPMLNEQQETALETLGIDPATLPSTISPEQEACFESQIGAERVREIKAGDTPTAAEILKGRGCL